ncbi:MAG: phosphate ABC transporter substrate-binding protein PstS [Planctomycetia bacterium]|nr:phosphate ABC transporter substrate-binding protein PstS [Planctomycetia bacterium]
MIFSGLLGLAGCSPSSDSTGTQIQINGAGATFPSPVYANWTYNYSESSNHKIQVNYQGVGSGAGINQLKEKTIDFAGSDAPLSGEEQEKAGLVQFPMLAGGIVVIFNLPGIKDAELKLSRKSLEGIWFGRIRKWNDPLLQKENPDLALPDLDITVVHRSDSSGTSFLFTAYLAKISPEWKEKIGVGKTVHWPTGIGGVKNPGVCNNVARIPGAIGYTEYTYAKEMKLCSASLQNRSNQYVVPDEDSFRNALEKIDWKASAGFSLDPVDAEGGKSWPILGITYILYRKDLKDPVRSELFPYFLWCFDAGKSSAVNMHYLPIPEAVADQIRTSVFKMEGPVQKTESVKNGEKE